MATKASMLAVGPLVIASWLAGGGVEPAPDGPAGINIPFVVDDTGDTINGALKVTGNVEAAQFVGRFTSGGGYQTTDTLGCTAANPLTSACSCPAGFSAVSFRVINDVRGGLFTGSNIILCVR